MGVQYGGASGEGVVRRLGREGGEGMFGVWPAWVISFWDLVGDFHRIWGKHGLGVATALVASPPPLLRARSGQQIITT